MIDDENLHRAFGLFELEAKLFPQGLLERGAKVAGGGRGGCAGRGVSAPLEDKVEGPSEAGAVQDGAINAAHLTEVCGEERDGNVTRAEADMTGRACRAGIDDAARQLFFGRDKEKSFAQVLAEFDTLNGINPHVKKMIEFLRRRDLGKHGRYLESLRS